MEEFMHVQKMFTDNGLPAPPMPPGLWNHLPPAPTMTTPAASPIDAVPGRPPFPFPPFQPVSPIPAPYPELPPVRCEHPALHNNHMHSAIQQPYEQQHYGQQHYGNLGVKNEEPPQQRQYKTFQQ